MKSEPYSLLDRKEKVLAMLAIFACGLSLLPLPLLFLGWWPLRFSIPFLVPPALLLLLALCVYASRGGAPVFWKRLGAGFLGGLLATVVYDLVRVFGLYARFPGFAVIHKFGLWITGAKVLTPAAALVGWGYHFMNGAVFGIIFSLIAGQKANIGWGIAWGLFLEVSMLWTYPNTFKIDMSWGTAALTFSLLGHIGYGATLGYIIRRRLRKEKAYV